MWGWQGGSDTSPRVTEGHEDCDTRLKLGHGGVGSHSQADLLEALFLLHTDCVIPQVMCVKVMRGHLNSGLRFLLSRRPERKEGSAGLIPGQQRPGELPTGASFPKKMLQDHLQWGHPSNAAHTQ